MLRTILELERPIAVLDLETTGLNPKVDRIIQIGLTIHYVHKDPIAWSSLIDPEIPIMNADKHGITDDDVLGSPTFADLAAELAARLLVVDIAGYNVTFDINFMRAEMERAKVDWPWENHVVDALNIFRKKHPHNLTNAYKHYVNPEGFEGAHDAGNDVLATTEVLYYQLSKHEDLPRRVAELSEFCFEKKPKDPSFIDDAGKFAWVGDVPTVNFGKWKGTPLKDLNRGYLTWMSNGEFAPDTKAIVNDALSKKYPTK